MLIHCVIFCKLPEFKHWYLGLVWFKTNLLYSGSTHIRYRGQSLGTSYMYWVTINLPSLYEHNMHLLSIWPFNVQIALFVGKSRVCMEAKIFEMIHKNTNVPQSMCTLSRSSLLSHQDNHLPHLCTQWCLWTPPSWSWYHAGCWKALETGNQTGKEEGGGDIGEVPLTVMLYLPKKPSSCSICPLQHVKGRYIASHAQYTYATPDIMSISLESRMQVIC